MHLVPSESATLHLVVSLSSEEALVLLQPGKMLRKTLDQNPELADRTRFLSLAKGGAGLLVLWPRAATALLMSVPDGHVLEREFKRLLFDTMASGERPRLEMAN